MRGTNSSIGITRRHWLKHLVGASSLALPAATLARSLQVHAETLRRSGKSAILLWMGGGPSTIDLWDLKPRAATGGDFKPISTKGEGQICEHLPKLAGQMQHLSIIRSMSTREADHQRGRYYMHTGYVPNPSVQHPSYGAVIAQQLVDQRPELELPPFVSIGGASVGPGFLGMAYAPFVVESNGRVKNLDLGTPTATFNRRLRMLNLIETKFVQQHRGRAASDHTEVLKKTRKLLSSKQLDAFKYELEPQAMRDRYGASDFGRGCLMARRLVEVGVPFVEVDFGGWDNHSNIFGTLAGKLPILDQAMSGLVEDLDQRGLLRDTAIICMGEFGRTPRINSNAGRDHWASSWSIVVGGAGFGGGRVVGETNGDGTEVISEPYSSQDLMATVCRALEIPLETVFMSRSGRPMKIANGGKIIDGLLT